MKNSIKSIFGVCVGLFLLGNKPANAQTDSIFNYSGAISGFTVPCGVTSVTITAYGGAGGGGSSNDGGLGAEIVGTFTVTPGDVLNVLVGQQGLSNNEGSGGGGSYVWNTNGTVLMVVAGGGGGGYQGGVGGNGSATNTPTDGTGPQGSSPAVSGGIGGASGTCSSSYAGGGGGAGWLSNGGDGSSCGGYGGGGGGVTALAGGAGGAANAANGCIYASQGGFGGGGASTCYAAGGGGGYNGGSGAIGFVAGGNGGGGGGSYNNGTSPINTAGVQAGDGQITISYTIPITPPITLAGNVINNVTCGGGSDGSASGIVSGGGGTYTYSSAPSGGITDTASGLSAGTYTLTVNDPCGNMATAAITITQPPVLTAVASAFANELCNGGSTGSATAVASGGTTPYTYSWTGGSTSASATGLSAGTFTLTVTDANGCNATSSATITQPTALSITKGTISAWVSSCNGEAFVTVSGGTAPYTYMWSPGGATTDTIKNLCDNNYCCTITDKNGCVDSACMSVVTGIPMMNNASSIKIFPNPSNGMFTISGLSKGMEVEVYNYMGEKINDIKATDANMQFNIADKSTGAYLVRVLSQDGKLVGQEKLMKQD